MLYVHVGEQMRSEMVFWKDRGTRDDQGCLVESVDAILDGEHSSSFHVRVQFRYWHSSKKRESQLQRLMNGAYGGLEQNRQPT